MTQTPPPEPAKRLLYVATRWPWPVSTGRQRMIDQSLRFAAEGGWKIVLLYAGRREAAASTCPLPDLEHHLLPMPRLPEAAVNLAVSGGRPLQDAFFGSRTAHDTVSRTIDDFDPDTIVVDMLRMAQFVEKLPRKPRGRLVLDMDDVLSLRYARMRETGTGNVLGAFGERLPKAVRIAADVVPKALLGIEERRMRVREREAPKGFDATMVVSPLEADHLRARIGRPISAHPPAVDEMPFRTRDYGKGLRVVFLGGDSYGPNAESLFEIDRVARILTESAPGLPIVFEAAGAVTRDLGLRHVRRLGFMPNLASLFTEDAVLLAPVRSGTGVKTKVLDAMAHSVPVLTTSLGIEGLAAVSESEIVVRDRVEDLASALIRFAGHETHRLASVARGGWGYAARLHLRHDVRRCFLSEIGGTPA
ncbi:hypothetical protein BHAOGJBA_1247 [Methylobacterium hispanicum]|uniref:Glycosyl transferase n=1 Tax=Methylobacterium hispanicum TaxID=270350 RepID=A0AAV4ZH87_9HYPH|nr:glycosyltransferase [Methylobacterium hispanicum]GJD87742.1 hypothetical protein BHAOGJBA_1247 [Methylobacterium hispanicum]